MPKQHIYGTGGQLLQVIDIPDAPLSDIGALDFLMRFTPAEYAAIKASADARAIYALGAFEKASVVAIAPGHLDYDRTTALMQLLVDSGCISPARRDAILTP
jgi:hypothetical protein